MRGRGWGGIGLGMEVDRGFKASGDWLNFRLCRGTPAAGRGWHEYQTAPACLIRPNSHARLQTTLYAAALIRQCLSKCMFECM